MRNDMWEFDTSTGKWKVLMGEMATSGASGALGGGFGGLWRRGGGAAVAALATACAAVLTVL